MPEGDILDGCFFLYVGQRGRVHSVLEGQEVKTGE